MITGKEIKFLIKYYLIIAFSFLLYLLLALGNNYVWADEAFSFGMTRRSFFELWNLPSIDSHPLFYYYYLKIFLTVFGSSVITAKIASILPYIFIISSGGSFLKKNFNETASISFMILFFFFPIILRYSIEIRMYSLAAAFVFSAAIYAYRCFIEDKGLNWIILVLSCIGAAHTHYYALVSIGIVMMILLVCICFRNPQKIKRWSISVMEMVLLYLPWISHFVRQLGYRFSHDYWITAITVKKILGYGFSIFNIGGIKILSILFALCFLVVFLYVLRKREGRLISISILLLLVPFVTLVAGITVSIIVRPVFVIRYIVPSLPLLILFMAISIGKMDSEKFRKGLLFFLIGCGMFNYCVFLQKEMKKPENELDKTMLSRYPYSLCESYVVLNDYSSHISTVLAYYENETPIYSEKKMSGKASPFPNIYQLSEFDEKEYDHVIFFLDPDDQIPQQYSKDHLIEFLGRVDEMGKKTDVYYLITD